ncbi:MAG TPA: hypothetical protein VH044_02925 [Polyangiaceae bacterium]|nr:hypothetical protein [Polyangiaceae bacterium]
MGIGALGVQMTACSSSSAPAQADASTVATALCTDGGLQVAFSPMYSAFDGKHTFQIPAVVAGSNMQVTWSADSSMVGMQTDGERPNEVLITALKAGSVAINVQSADGKCGSSILTISPAAESDWEIGNARYNDGKSLHLQGGASPGNGSPLEEANGGGGPACTNCHGELATDSVYTDVSHTPEQTGGFSDDDLVNIITKGTFPDGGYFDNTIAIYQAWMNFHRWTDITADQQRGIIVYLRSLPPAPQKGAVNFGAFDTDGGGVAGDMDADLDAGPDVTQVVTDGAADATTVDAGATDSAADSAVDASDASDN